MSATVESGMTLSTKQPDIYALRGYLRRQKLELARDASLPPLVSIAKLRHILEGGWARAPSLLAVDVMGASSVELSSLREIVGAHDLCVWEPVRATVLQSDFGEAATGFVLCGYADAATASAVAAFREWLVNVGFRSALRELGIISSQLVSNVEVTTLNTASRIEAEWHTQTHLEHPVYDIHSRSYVQEQEPFDLGEFRDVVFTTNRSWKVLTRESRYIEDIGYTSNTGLHGIEFWPDFCVRTSIRSVAPVVGLDFGAFTPFLLGYDGAYYHWLLNWLPRLMAFDLFPDRLGRLQDAKILTGRLSKNCKESLLHFGVADSNVIELDDLINYQASHVIVPSFISNSRVSRNISGWYRRRMRRSTPSKQGERIYISRSDATWSGRPRRQVVNEEEVIACLASRGFRPHVLSSYSFQEQVDLFAGAEFVVAAHGAGLANMVFSPPGTPAIVFENGFRHTFMQEMLNALGHRAEIFDGEDVFVAADEEAYLAEGMPEAEVMRNRNLQILPSALLASVDSMLDER